MSKKKSLKDKLNFVNFFQKIDRVKASITHEQKNLKNKEKEFQKCLKRVWRLDLNVDKAINNEIKSTIKENNEKLKNNPLVDRIKKLAMLRKGGKGAHQNMTS